MRLLACAALLCSGSALAQTPYETANRLRAAPPCAESARREPLRQSAQLERAAALLAAGTDLDAALKQAGYRANRSHVLNMASNVVPAELTLMFVKRHCELIADPSLLEVGFHQQPGALTAVLAVPFVPTAAEAKIQANASTKADANTKAAPKPAAPGAPR